MQSVYINEFFTSLQGEGIYQGVKQIFIRFAGCNLHCDYCDTLESQFTVYSLQFTVKEAMEKIKEIDNGRYHSISLTGGEPLLQVNFLEELVPQIKKLGLKIYLETNGTLPQELKKIVGLIDFIAMDIKLPSATKKDLFSEHYDFLRISKLANQPTSQPVKIFVKIVLTKKTLDEEIKKSINLIKEINPEIPLVLQPVTPSNGVYPPERKRILSWSTLAKNSLSNVRIIRQKHKLLGIK